MELAEFFPHEEQRWCKEEEDFLSFSLAAVLSLLKIDSFAASMRKRRSLRDVFFLPKTKKSFSLFHSSENGSLFRRMTRAHQNEVWVKQSKGLRRLCCVSSHHHLS